MSIKKQFHQLFSSIKKHHKKIITVFFISISILAIERTTSLWNTKSVYYLNKDSGIRCEERIKIIPTRAESYLQAFIRFYLSGSQNYKTKIPFIHEALLLSISHDKENNILILNWNSYFYKALESNNIEEEIKILLLSLKKNFPLEKVYFLIEGSQIIEQWQGVELGSGINLNKIK